MCERRKPPFRSSVFVFLLNDAARRAVVDVNRCFKQDAFFFYLPGLQNKRLHGDAADKQAQVAMHFSPSLPSWLSVELALQDHVNSALLDLIPPPLHLLLLLLLQQQD